MVLQLTSVSVLGVGILWLIKTIFDSSDKVLKKRRVKGKVMKISAKEQARQRTGRNNQRIVKELPPFNHPKRKEVFEITSVKHDRIGKHDFVPLYKDGKNVAGTILSSKEKFGSKKNYRTSEGYLGNKIHHKIAKVDLTEDILNFKKRVRYQEEEYHSFLANNKENFKSYDEFIRKKQNYFCF